MDRQELIRNAISFLSDPKTQASPLAQRVQFLEAKGLTAQEIEEAMRQANHSHIVSIPQGPVLQQQVTPYTQSYGSPISYTAQSSTQPWDWRDYFITAVVSGVITYGAVSLFRKYISPHVRPPTATAYEEDKDSLTAQFDAAEALLKDIQSETAAVRAAVEEQQERVHKATQDVESVARNLKEGEARTRDEMREIREEVGHVREMLPKMIEKNKESQTQSLVELQQELKSLKALLLNRGPGSVSGFTTPTLPSKASIPAWQLSTPSTPSPSASSTIPMVSAAGLVASDGRDEPQLSGKGKEPDTARDIDRDTL